MTATILNIFNKILLMLISLLMFFVTIFTVGVLLPLDPVAPVVTETPIVISNISILDVSTGDEVPGRTVLISDKRIQEVGFPRDIVIPENAIHIDGSDRFLMPSLWDMHTHIYKVTPLLDMPLYIGYGVTNVRDMTSCPKESDPFVPCPAQLRAWNHAAINGQLVAPRIQGITSWHLNGPEIHKRIKGLPEFFGAANPQQARDLVRYYLGKVDSIKVYNNIPRDAYFALVDEANKVGLDVIGHRPRALSAIEAAANQKSIEHARFILHESFDGSKALRDSAEKTGIWREDRRRMLDTHESEIANDIFVAMKNHGTWYVPTHLTRRVDAYGDDPIILEDPLLRYLHPLMKLQWLEDVNATIDADPSPEARQTYREFYQKGLKLTGDAHKAGVRILVGTDYIVAGATVHDELAQLVLAGLTPVEALRAATLSPAEYFGLEHDYGKVAEGMVADLVLLNKNPFENIRHSMSIESVIFNGNLYDKEKLSAIYMHVANRARSWSVACKILWEFLKNPVNY